MKKKRAWVVAADMGYGHQRAAYPLKDIAYERIINANSDKITSKYEQKQWKKFRRYYEGLSRFRSVPLIGPVLWSVYDRFQKISPYYPFQDLSKPTYTSLYMHNLIKKGFLKSVTDYVSKKDLPFISTFFATAIAAAHAKLKNVYCVVTDTDINRIWVPENPKDEKLVYFTPTEHSTRRLLEYGVPKERIIFTGFPLPKENTGPNMEILRRDLGNRLANLDPNRIFINRYKETLRKYLGKDLKKKSDHPLTITFAVGGAGAQKEIGAKIMHSLKDKIREGKVILNLLSGIHLEVASYLSDCAHEAGIGDLLGKRIHIIAEIDKKSYFQSFNEMLRKTDILWTKPSELSFYTALGLPIIISPPLGAHEELNADWLLKMGTGFHQEDPDFANEWLFEWIEKGFLAEAAWEGYLEAPKYGTYNIENIVFGVKSKLKY